MRKKKERELSQKQKEQLRSLSQERQADQQTLLNTTEIQEGPKGGKPKEK